MIINCSGERSFSRFKRTKNELKITVSQAGFYFSLKISVICHIIVVKLAVTVFSIDYLFRHYDRIDLKIFGFAMKKARTKPVNCLLCYV